MRKMNAPCRQKSLSAAGILLAISAGMILTSSGCKGKEQQSAAGPRAVPVTVTKCQRRPEPVSVKTFGVVEAYATVSIKSLVEGQLMSVDFKAGQYIKTGDPLFTIDKRPYETSIQQLQANLMRDTANYGDAQRRAKDIRELLQKGAAASDESLSADASAEALRQQVESDKAALENAKLNLGYCDIRSPLDGRAGDVLVKAGNLVKVNDVAMATVMQTKPIYVTFSVAQAHLPEIRKYQATSPLKVEAKIPSDVEAVTETGSLAFINNTVDISTGTILLKGQFANESEHLWPGQFVNVTLTLRVQDEAVVVPTRCVQIGQEGQYVYVVNGDQAELKFVKVDRTIDEDTVIADGLFGGETVVLDGQLRLSPGAKVEIQQISAVGATSVPAK